MSQAAIGADVRGEPISNDPVLGYFQRSELPLASLLFILPLMVLYELGTRFIVSQPNGGETRIIAFTLMRDFFSLFGATGRYLPCLAVIGILLTWHIARRDGWKVQWGTLSGMVVESLVLALPVLGLSYAVTRYVIPPLAGTVGVADPLSMLVLSIGAGIYEEAVFRLGAITLLNLLLVDAVKIHRIVAIPAMVGLSALLFSGYHYLGNEPFQVQTFVFRTAAGLYFGGLFVLRGFGITAGCHAFYDVLVVLLPLLVRR